MLICENKIRKLSKDLYINDMYAFDQAIEKTISIKKNFDIKSIFSSSDIINILNCILSDLGFNNCATFEINELDYSFVKNCHFSFSKFDYESNNIHSVIHELSHFLSLKLFNHHNAIYHDYLFSGIMLYLYQTYNILTLQDIKLAHFLSGEKIKFFNAFDIEKIENGKEKKIISTLNLIQENIVFHPSIERFIGQDEIHSYCLILNKNQNSIFLSKRKLYKFEKNKEN